MTYLRHISRYKIIATNLLHHVRLYYVLQANDVADERKLFGPKMRRAVGKITHSSDRVEGKTHHLKAGKGTGVTAELPKIIRSMSFHINVW